MAQVKVSELTEATTMASGDFVLSTEVASPASKRITLANFKSAIKTLGEYKTIYVPVTQIVPRSDSGATPGVYESPTYKVHFETLDFDPDVIQYGQFNIIMPEDWDLSTVKVKFAWMADTGTGDAIWNIQSQALTDSDVIDAAFGTAATVTDALTTLLDYQLSGATGAMTVAATPVLNDMICFQVYRDATNGSDTFTGNARLIGVFVQYNTTVTPSGWQ